MRKSNNRGIACRAERVALAHLADTLNLLTATGYRETDLHRDAVEVLRALAPLSMAIAEAADVVDVDRTRFADPRLVAPRIWSRRRAIARLVKLAGVGCRSRP